MTCLRKNILMEYIDNELSGEKLRRVEAHLSGCPACRENLEQMKTDIDLVMENMEMLDPVDIPADTSITMPAEEKKAGTGRISLPAFRWWDWRVAVAGSLFIFILGFFVGKYFISPSPPDMLVKLESPEHLRFVLQEHFENIKPVLIEYANFSLSEEGDLDVLLDKEFVTTLVEQNQLIKKRIPVDKDGYLRQLLDELEVILREISRLTEDDPGALSVIKKLIKEKEILFKLEASNPHDSDLLKI